MVGALPRPLVPADFGLSRVWGHTGRTLRSESGHPAWLDPKGGLPRPRGPSGGGSFRASVLSAAFFLDLFAL